MANGKVLGLAAALLIAGGAVGGMAAAQTAGGGDDAPTAPTMLRVLDTDNDGKVTMAEIEAEQKRLIGAADLNGDGKLSVEEFRRRGSWFQRMHTTTLFDLMDTNGDQVLSADEIANPSARWFKRYDANADGAIVTEEVPQLQQRPGGHRR